MHQERLVKMILAEKIIKLRKQNGWSQEELAEQMGISRQSVSKWESGNSIPDLDKIIKMSGIFGVTTDYLLKDDLEEVTVSESIEIYEEPKVRRVSLEEANIFMELTQKFAGRIALAVSILILSPVCLILFGGLSEYGKSGISENMAGAMGVAILLLLVAIGVMILILDGMQLSKYEYLEKEAISLEYGVQGIVQKKKEEYATVYQRSIAAGVALCILGVVPLLIAGAVDAGDLIYVYCVDILLFMVACGVNLFVRSGMIHGSYVKLLEEEDYTKEKKEMNKRTSFFPGVYWCIIVAIYLAISLHHNNWERSWIIWPVAGVLFAALQGILNIIMKPRKLE